MPRSEVHQAKSTLYPYDTIDVIIRNVEVVCSPSPNQPYFVRR